MPNLSFPFSQLSASEMKKIVIQSEGEFDISWRCPLIVCPPGVTERVQTSACDSA